MPAFNKSTKAEKITLAILLIIFAISTTLLFVNDGKLLKPKNSNQGQELIDPVKMETP